MNVNMENKIKSRKKFVKKIKARWKRTIIHGGLTILLVCISMGSAWKLIEYYTMLETAENDFKSMAQQLQNENANTEENKVLFSQYEDLHAKNPDFVGWIQLEETPINYPIMQTSAIPDFYLRKNFDKEYSVSGTPFLDVRCDMNEGSNLIVYSHNMNNGSMFGVLQKYLDQDFGSRQANFICNSLTEIREYQLVAVLHFFDSQENFEAYYRVPQTEEELNAYVDQLRNDSIYDMGIEAKWGDQLLTLSTCDKNDRNRRILVVAVKITDTPRE